MTYLLEKQKGGVGSTFGCMLSELQEGGCIVVNLLSLFCVCVCVCVCLDWDWGWTTPLVRVRVKWMGGWSGGENSMLSGCAEGVWNVNRFVKGVFCFVLFCVRKGARCEDGD